MTTIIHQEEQLPLLRSRLSCLENYRGFDILVRIKTMTSLKDEAPTTNNLKKKNNKKKRKKTKTKKWEEEEEDGSYQ